MGAAPLLSVENLARSFTVARGRFGRSGRVLKAVDGVSFSLGRRQTLALVGESGSGKSTTGRLAIGLIEPTGGRVRCLGRDLAGLGGAAWRQARRDMQMIFQDSSGALDPRMTVGAQIAEVIAVHGLADGPRAAGELAADMLDRVGLGGGALAARYPRELSGGQRQRVVIARALVMQPKLIVCDEPVSALDVSVQAQIVNLLAEAQERLGVSYLFISHDLRVVRHVADHVAVMYMGRIVEIGPVAAVYGTPLHPYTRALLAAVPTLEERGRSAAPLAGELPDPTGLPVGCRFQARCPAAREACRRSEPALLDAGDGHAAACHLLAPETGPKVHQ